MMNMNHPRPTVVTVGHLVWYGLGTLITQKCPIQQGVSLEVLSKGVETQMWSMG